MQITIPKMGIICFIVDEKANVENKIVLIAIKKLFV